MGDKQKQTENPKLTVNKKNSGPTTPNNGPKAVSVQPQTTLRPAVPSAVPERASEKKLDSDKSINSAFGPKKELQTTPIVSMPTPTATAGIPRTLAAPQQLQEPQTTPKVSTPQQLLRTSKQVSSKADNYYDAMPAKTSHNIPPDINRLTEEQLKAQLEKIEMSEKKAVEQNTQAISAVQPPQPSPPSPSPPFPPQPLQAAKPQVNSLSQITYPKSVPKVSPKRTVASKTSSSTLSKGSIASATWTDKSIKCNECNCSCIIPIVAARCKKCGCVCSSIRNLDTCSHKFSVFVKHAQTFTKFEESKTENKKQTGIEESKSTANKKTSDNLDKRSKSK